MKVMIPDENHKLTHLKYHHKDKNGNAVLNKLRNHFIGWRGQRKTNLNA